MASTPPHPGPAGRLLSTIRKSQETVIDAIKTWVETVQSITPKIPRFRVPGADKLPKPGGGRGPRLPASPSELLSRPAEVRTTRC